MQGSKDRLILNLAEMWGSLLFQTLTEAHLGDWHPLDHVPWAGRHLNVGLPLLQPFSRAVRGARIVKFNTEP